LIGRRVTTVSPKEYGGGLRLQGRIEDVKEDRVKVSLTFAPQFASGDLLGYGYNFVAEGDTVWTPAKIWSVE
jgi:hypothetical protein